MGKQWVIRTRNSIFVEKVSSMPKRQIGSDNSQAYSHRGKKLIYQTAWRENGEFAGPVETSMVIPEDMTLYLRQ